MIRIPMEVFAYTNEAALMARGERILYANAAAKELLGKNCQNRSLSSLLGADVAQTQASNFVSDLCIDGRHYALRATKQEGGELFFITGGGPELGVVNDALIYSLRSSLMTLNVALDLCRVRAEEQGNEELLLTMRDISRSQYRIARLVSNASMLRDHIQGSLNFSPVRVDIGLLCRECAGCMSALLDGIEIRSDIACGNFINADPELVKKLVLNLISNCVLHAEGLSFISLNLIDTPESVVISVSDNGSGIEPQQLHRVFDRYRYAYDMADMPGGAGMGLSIARVIAQRHGGTLLMESRPGHGTTVRISLKKNKGLSIGLRSSGEAEHFDIKTALLELSDCLDSSFYGEKYMD